MSALIHLDNLKHNINLVRTLIGPHRKICLPVKAKAYGHGMIPIAKTAREMGCEYLSVARTSEAQELRDAGIEGPVMVMSQVPHKELDQLLSLNVELFAGSAEYIDALEKAAGSRQKGSPEVQVHLKADTGMGRIGCPPQNTVELAQKILESPYLELRGLCTHFSVSDETDRDSLNFTRMQIETLARLGREIKDLPSCNGDFLIHGANSGAVAQHEESYFDMVRPGILLYGYEPVPTAPLGVKPLMELESELVFIKKVKPGETLSYGRTWKADRETWIGTIPLGYGDGYSRLLSNRGEVWIKGKTYPVAGRICMDQFMVDLGPDYQGKTGDRVTLFGPAPCPFSAAHIATLMGTISYEVCCLITERVPRIYQP
jgi:alanine racemase